MHPRASLGPPPREMTVSLDRRRGKEGLAHWVFPSLGVPIRRPACIVPWRYHTWRITGYSYMACISILRMVCEPRGPLFYSYLEGHGYQCRAVGSMAHEYVYWRCRCSISVELYGGRAARNGSEAQGTKVLACRITCGRAKNCISRQQWIDGGFFLASSPFLADLPDLCDVPTAEHACLWLGIDSL